MGVRASYHIKYNLLPRFVVKVEQYLLRSRQKDPRKHIYMYIVLLFKYVSPPEITAKAALIKSSNFSYSFPELHVRKQFLPNPLDFHHSIWHPI